MAGGFVSLVDGECVESASAATVGVCAGYPKLELLGSGVTRVTYCSGVADGEAGFAGAFNGSIDVFDGDTPVASVPVVQYLEGCQMPDSPWAMSPEDAALVGAAVVAVWLTAFGWRALRSSVAGGASSD